MGVTSAAETTASENWRLPWERSLASFYGMQLMAFPVGLLLLVVPESTLRDGGISLTEQVVLYWSFAFVLGYLQWFKLVAFFVGGWWDMRKREEIRLGLRD